jgi:hypothetical protein
MQHFWDLLFQPMKHETNISRYVYIFVQCTYSDAYFVHSVMQEPVDYFILPQDSRMVPDAHSNPIKDGPR